MTYVIVRQNHSISDVLLKLAERTERTHSTLLGHVAVVVFRALIVITSVDCLGSVALRSEMLCLPFFHLFDFFDISKCSHRFHFQAQKDHWCVRPFLTKNNSLPLLMIQSRQDTHTQKPWNYALKVSRDTFHFPWKRKFSFFSLSSGSGWGQNTKNNGVLQVKFCIFTCPKDRHFSWQMNIRLSVQNVTFRLPCSLFFYNQQ